ncbi:MAG: recombinase family protein [Bacteroidota bacterium]
MLETLNIINAMVESGVNLIFVRQLDLSTNGPHGKLLLAIYSYYAEAERDYISIRTKQGLATARVKGVKLGRPRGSQNKERRLDPFRDQILEFKEIGLSMTSILKIINNQIDEPVSYNTLRYFIRSISF